MSTTSQSFSVSGPSDSESPLHLLARVAAESRRLDSPLDLPVDASISPKIFPILRSSKRVSERRDASLSPSESESTTSRSLSPTPTLVERSDLCPISSKARKSCHRSPKVTEAQKSARAAAEPRRKQILARALRIKTVENSPVNEQQLRVLRMVFDEITKYPKDSFIAILSCIIHRSYGQTKNWFSNERCKNKSGESIDWCNNLGEKIRLRPMAIQLREEWSDEVFEEFVMVYNYTSTKRIHWVD
jgi:hypothetical protein